MALNFDADAMVGLVDADAVEADLQAHRLRDATDGDEAVHHADCADAVDARRVDRHRGMGLGIETRGYVEQCAARDLGARRAMPTGTAVIGPTPGLVPSKFHKDCGTGRPLFAAADVDR